MSRPLVQRRAAVLLAVGVLFRPAAALAQDFEFEEEPARRSVGAVLDLSRSLGDLNVFADRGIGGNVNVRLPWRGSRLVSLRGDLAGGTFTGEGRAGGSTVGSVSWNNRFTSVTALVGAQVTADNEVVRPYVHAGVGAGFATARQVPDGVGITRRTTNGVGLAWQAGVGAYRVFGESEREWALDVGVRLLGLPPIDVPRVRVVGPSGQQSFEQSNGSGSRAGWSFSIGVHFAP